MEEKIVSLQPSFSNQVIDKSQLKQLIIWAFRNYGIARAANMADKLKDLGFYYATKAGISLSLEDLKIPPAKKQLLASTMNSITSTDNKYYRGEITAVERFQKVIDTWNNASESLKKEVIKYFRETDPLNSIYMIAFSGARGNISQVRQLVGMRGLMSDPQGQIIDLPISSNFREGLTVTDYFISSYGARKGLVDIALRTADSGYLTRRLVDVSQDVIIRETDCKTRRGILLEDMVENQKHLISLEQSLIGRTLCDDLVDITNNQVLAKANQSITPSLASNIVAADIHKVLVRSPITCNSVGSVCQFCYGWNLAHGKLVDLGEAVGIIAAQSIGEPGTQLTMRTFHTGGVFTGELAQQIVASQGGILEYDLKGNPNIIRTRHGEPAYLITQDSSVRLQFSNGEEEIIDIGKGTILLEKNHAYVNKGQIIAEYPLSNRLITERAQKSILADFSGKVQFTNLTVEEIQSKQHTIRIAKDGGLVWVLSGKTYRIPDNAKLLIKPGDHINEETVLATIEMTSKYSGQVELVDTGDQQELLYKEIKVILDSKFLTSSKVYYDNEFSNGSYILEINTNEKFLLYIKPNDILHDQQILGELITDTYITQTGGIVKYLDLPVAKHKSTTSNTKEKYDILGPGYILWISEETHEINKDISLLFVNNSDFIEAGTEIVKNVFAKNSGIVEIIEKDGVALEVVIKPGDIYMITEDSINTSKTRGFLRPGEIVVQGITTNKLVYWESIQTNSNHYLLIRPVIVYSIPYKQYELDCKAEKYKYLELEVVQRTGFKDGDRVKSVQGVNLVKTYLSIHINNNDNLLNCNVKFKNENNNTFCLHFLIAETLSLKKDNLYRSEDIDCDTQLLVQNNEMISENQTIARTNIISKGQGFVEYIDNSNEYNRRLLVVTDMDKKIFNVNGLSVKVDIDQWIYAGDEIADNIYSLESGQVVHISKFEVTMRIGRPYLVSPGTILHVNNANLVQRGENLATLIFERPKTGDIVQGLPRVEEILEARKKSDTNFNPHIILEDSFRSYLNLGLSLYNAAILSIQEIQLFLVKEVQLVYQSQGVDISDKHIEVIVRQMTSKVKIELGGDTDCLPGEMIELQKIHAINHTMNIMNKREATYYPILLGITKASLNTDSFISAASFQETTKVLTEAAISGKLDWLKGLKENVIIGRLIPAGTGFNIYNKNVNVEQPLLNKKIDDLQIMQATTNNNNTMSEIDDIILDDRSARDYQIPSN
uniref:DNA-directed RNA polymerase subunit beta'' n=1 Tax=Helminthora furcellata TaxID=1884666 RepID=A0A1G4NR63_9FLOR|nr:RNA polymerase b???-subunit [Helminthora furcellata]SCW21141.1 RNA polymerase b???-subunit [Helminthora furcellata]SCW24001.1 RNA polymerase beta-subunit [Helminthora furcellata]